MTVDIRRSDAPARAGPPLRDPGQLLDELAGLAHALASAADLPTTYRALFAFAQLVSPTNGIFVSLYDPKRDERTCVYSAGDDGEDDVSSLPPMPMSGSPQSVAIAAGTPVVTADLQAALAGKPVVSLGDDADPRFPQSSIAVPMVVLGRTIGAFEVQSVEPAAYTDEHVVAMTLAGNIAAIATARVRDAVPEGRQLAAEREEIRSIIAAGAFATVFQPIVELESRTTIGYEALTRFADGTPPDVRFAQASASGLGLELEAATLEAAFRASEALPANVLLNLNVSPALVLAGEPLGGILRQWGWQTILELTEHTAVDDYGALRAAIARLGPSVRLAIDDAGAGFASFRHILELAPQFVKLDRAIIAGLDADPARQAFVAGMRHFAVTTGCGLIAEGIETEEELATLRSLGISLGQGYYLGRPEAPG
jgi:EAL domain-containing protein (putative c-di-GMP-specific phosphodiesterase class I)